MSEPETNGPAGPDDLPQSHSADRIVLMPRDPEWLYTYWEISPERYEAALAELGVDADTAQPILRVHDVTNLIDTASGEPRLDESKNYLTIDVTPSVDHWYFKVDGPDRLYCVEYRVGVPDGRSVVLATSNMATTPPDRVSDITEETWVTAASKDKPAEKPSGPAETKWLEGQDNMHEALSSSGSASRPSKPPPTETPS